MPSFFLLFLALIFSQTLATNSFAESSLATPIPLTDDLNYTGLETALEKSRDFFDTAAEQIFNLCGQSLSGLELSRAYSQILNRLADKENKDLDLFFSENFTSCRPTSLLVTGYYTPIFPGSLTPSDRYRFPLYTPPDQEQLRCLSRAEIDTDTPLKGHEIAYLADPLDLFFLHVQGSGIIQLPDGSRRLAAYAANNGRPYTSIGRVLIQEGLLQKEEVSLASIRNYLNGHPEQRDRILHHNERYIFFRLNTPEPGKILPTGSLGCPLTPGRSVAMDASHYPPGILGVLTSSRPVLNKNSKVAWQPFTRLVTHQDSGAAIEGAHRLDLYMGVGRKAGGKAGVMKEKGRFAILIPNLSLRRVRSKIVSSENIGQQPKEPAH
ncbi:MAG: MltA domain-containing protein [Thermodesulfobacteriota bacterium]